MKHASDTLTQIVSTPHSYQVAPYYN